MSPTFPFSRVLVTGGTGFLGCAIHRALLKRGVSDIVLLSSSHADLRDREQAHTIIKKYAPECIIHCAVQGGGIGWMKDHPVESGLDNVRMNLNILEAALRSGVQSVIGVSSACVYPKHGSIPYREDSVWEGYPEPLNGSYALSKRIMMDMGRAYAKQHGMHSAFPVLANLYGIGDHTDSARAHVVADLMIRCTQKPKELIVWGTGIALREFLFVEDAAEGVLACVHAPSASIINIGTGIETPILRLAEQTIAAHGLDIPIVLDERKPNGQLRKVLDVQKAQKILDWKARYSLEEGLSITARWYCGTPAAELLSI
jgi:GDP-L-fucose synthase